MKSLKISLYAFLLCMLYSVFNPENGFAKKKKNYQIAMPTRIDTVVYEIAERMPKFRGKDLNEFGRWLSLEVNYPREVSQRNIEGRVLVSFIIEQDGEISNPIIRESPHEALSREVLKAVKKSPRWEPGINKNNRVRCMVIVPVIFKLEGGGPSRRSTVREAGSGRIPGSPMSGRGGYRGR